MIPFLNHNSFSGIEPKRKMRKTAKRNILVHSFRFHGGVLKHMSLPIFIFLKKESIFYIKKSEELE